MHQSIGTSARLLSSVQKTENVGFRFPTLRHKPHFIEIFVRRNCWFPNWFPFTEGLLLSPKGCYEAIRAIAAI